MFADDTNLFISNSNIENLFETMNEELRKVAIWFKANKLRLFEVAIESWTEWDLNPQPLNSVQTL